MERLTYDFEIGGNHCWQVKGADNLECREVCERQGDDGCRTCPIAKAFDRLAAYEDTGLEPEEIELLAKQRDLYVDACGELPLKRIRELAQADREGRVVVLPCKPSDVTVYQLRNKKQARGIGVSPRHISCATVWAGGHYALHHQGQDDCLGRDFKKTWFLDKAEAEAALRRGQE